MSILTTMRTGWVGTIGSFLTTDREVWIGSLESHNQTSLGEAASQANRTAWLNCHAVLTDQLGRLAAKRSDVTEWGITFEYELPRERGRRVDVAILAGKSVVLLEFKDFSDTLRAHVDQVAAYARDLSSYQTACHNRSVIPILVKTLSNEDPTDFGQVCVTGANGLCAAIERTAVSGKPWISIGDWINSPYAPLPSLVRAARTIFKHEPLPRIKQAESAGVDEAVQTVAAIIEEARSKSERHIVFVTGVPGAGKTLTGLQLVYTLTLADDTDRAAGVFLSGNGPLVAVLQYALRGKERVRSQADASRVFVRDVLAFVRDHIGPQAPLPPEHVWVYDEAQRA